jgi:hypothetical protein
MTSHVPHVLSLAGIATQNRLSKRNPTSFSVFCGKKLNEENDGKSSIQRCQMRLLIILSFLGKENGQKMTLPQLLTERSDELSTAFGDLSNEDKRELLARHLDSKESNDTPKRLSNVAVSRAVNLKLKVIINTVLYDLGHLPNATLSSL